jgi:hypothetical protein
MFDRVWIQGKALRAGEMFLEVSLIGARQTVKII